MLIFNEGCKINMMRQLFRGFPYPIKVLLKMMFAPKYYFQIIKNDLTAFMGRTPGKTKILFVAGYPKSGTTWVENFISHLPGYNPRVLGGDQEFLRYHELSPNAFERIPMHGYSAIKTHINPSKRNIDILIKNGINKVLVMYRDPRDIVVSNYYYVLKSNPWKPEDPFYADYTKMSKEEALTHTLNMVINNYGEWVQGWKKIANDNSGIDCLFLRYEDLLNNPRESFEKILSFYGVTLSEIQFNKLILASEHKIYKIFPVSLMPGGRSTKRKGMSGEWISELNEEQKKLFKEKIGKLLVELEYEKNIEWC